MKKVLKKIALTIGIIVAVLLVFTLVLAYLPIKLKTEHKGITPDEAVQMRQQFAGPHHTFTTSDGVTLFLREWDPDSLEPAKKDIVVLFFHGFTAHSGAYEMAGVPFSKGGYTTMGLDYRGHGLSDGPRGDIKNKERWIADLAETVKYVKGLGYNRVIVAGHSLGVAAAICAANADPGDIAGLILLSGAYEGKNKTSTPIPLFRKMKMLASSIVRPSRPVVKGYRPGMTGEHDPLFNYQYTLRYMTMIDVKKLRLPETLNVPILVASGDQDEIFDVAKVKEFYDLIPSPKKEFMVLKNASHAVIPVECWEEVVVWMNRTY